ncbi:carbonic anhydrase family protein [Actinoplanes sp. NPDC049118]|uniref:carbonic anhydrase n=1 Tax=Actinoplanes sp. NPDC049118 TaxID=3155769 RepID=UPI0033D6396D
MPPADRWRDSPSGRNLNPTAREVPMFGTPRFAAALAAGLLVVCPLAVSPAWGADAQAWNHDVADPVRGPAAWGLVDPSFEACASGQAQSPVELTVTRSARLAPLRLDDPASPLVVENTGHVIEVPIGAEVGAVLRVGNDVYRLEQFHFHAPSEHTVLGRHADLEAHLVHRDSAGRLAVVAVLMNIGRQPNALVDRIAAAAPMEAGEERDTGTVVWPTDLLAVRSHVGRARVDRYLTFAGSLTTPPCTEGVRWFVAEQPTIVSATAVRRLHLRIMHFPGYNGYSDNNRPTQPRNERSVLRSRR